MIFNKNFILSHLSKEIIDNILKTWIVSRHGHLFFFWKRAMLLHNFARLSRAKPFPLPRKLQKPALRCDFKRKSSTYSLLNETLRNTRFSSKFLLFNENFKSIILSNTKKKITQENTVFSAMISSQHTQHTDAESNLTVNGSREIINSLIAKFDANY